MKQKNEFLVHHIFLIFHFILFIGSMLIFFVVILETKKLFPIFSCLITCLIYGSKNYSGTKVFLKSRFILCKTSMKGSYFIKIVGFFPATFSKINTVRWFFQGYYRDLSNFLLYSMFPEDLPMVVSITFFKK